VTVDWCYDGSDQGRSKDEIVASALRRIAYWMKSTRRLRLRCFSGNGNYNDDCKKALSSFIVPLTLLFPKSSTLIDLEVSGRRVVALAARDNDNIGLIPPTANENSNTNSITTQHLLQVRLQDIHYLFKLQSVRFELCRLINPNNTSKQGQNLDIIPPTSTPPLLQLRQLEVIECFSFFNNNDITNNNNNDNDTAYKYCSSFLDLSRLSIFRLTKS
jgi:hypothetical protein